MATVLAPGAWSAATPATFGGNRPGVPGRPFWTAIPFDRALLMARLAIRTYSPDRIRRSPERIPATDSAEAGAPSLIATVTGRLRGVSRPGPENERRRQPPWTCGRAAARACPVDLGGSFRLSGVVDDASGDRRERARQVVDTTG